MSGVTGVVAIPHGCDYFKNPIEGENVLGMVAFLVKSTIVTPRLLTTYINIGSPVFNR